MFISGPGDARVQGELCVFEFFRMNAIEIILLLLTPWLLLFGLDWGCKSMEAYDRHQERSGWNSTTIT